MKRGKDSSVLSSGLGGPSTAADSGGSTMGFRTNASTGMLRHLCVSPAKERQRDLGTAVDSPF